MTKYGKNNKIRIIQNINFYKDILKRRVFDKAVMYLRHEIGKKGEDLATKYLENLGYTIIERNFVAKQGEIDIIAKDKEELVFIEVKTRTNALYGKPVEAVNLPKQKHLISTVKYYLYVNHLENKFVRLDIIEVYLKENTYRINHIRQII